MAQSEAVTSTSSDRVVPQLSLLAGRALLYLILLLMVAGVIWASLTSINVVVSADGRLVPRGESLRLSVAQGGIISGVLVEVGGKVRKGQPILEVDSFRESADTARASYEIEQARTEALRYRRSAAALALAAANLRQELNTAQRVEKIISKEAVMVNEVYSENAVSLFELQSKQREVEESQEKVAELESNLNRSQDEGDEDLRMAAETDQKIKELNVELSRDIQAKQKTVVMAPIAGTVTYVSSLRPGRYLAANEVAVTIYPSNEPLLAEVWIPNESIRRVKPLLVARMKLKAYPFQQFGLLPGKLISVDPDADDKGSYRAWIRLDRLTLDGAQGPETVRMGLALSAEIVVDRQSVMNVILDPLRRLRRGASSIAE
jgi:hemolysin D